MLYCVLSVAEVQVATAWYLLHSFKDMFTLHETFLQLLTIEERFYKVLCAVPYVTGKTGVKLIRVPLGNGTHKLPQHFHAAVLGFDSILQSCLCLAPILASNDGVHGGIAGLVNG